MNAPPPSPIERARGLLGIDRLVLSIHQASFPGGTDDLGVGTPYSGAAASFFERVAALGFTGVAFGPGGLTSRINASPYDGTTFSRNPLHIALGPLTGSAWGSLLDDKRLLAAVRSCSQHPSYEQAWVAQRGLLAEVTAALVGQQRHRAHGELALLRLRWPWLAAEARFEGIAAAIGHDDVRRWPDVLPAADPRAARAFELEQVIVHMQHDELRERLRGLRLRLYADIPIGISQRDRFLHRGIFLPGYAMGAPPSRTNPAGQPWGYPILDPDRMGEGGEARTFVLDRLDKLMSEHDGLRVDHPHGWVCPWVYDAEASDALGAVQRGARLHESPDLLDHPRLSRFARVRPQQIDRSAPRYADDWVTDLEPAQIDRYAVQIDLLVDRVRVRGGDPADLMLEVLSTCPRPLLEVLRRHRLGRFRVTQKARPLDPTDVYRGDRASPQDWIMVGNHDTPPLARVIDGWQGTSDLVARAAYLAERLAPDAGERARLAESIERDPRAATTAMIAELFLGPARNVIVFWADLFGERRIYNRPGEVDPANWSLRVPSDFDAAYERALASGQAPDLGLALAWALRARGLDRDVEGRAVAQALMRQ